jgi:transcriptional regulator GlxA family with amidase domain
MIGLLCFVLTILILPFAGGRGILDGRRATTHWSHAEELGRRFPKIIVEMDRIFVADGPVWTSAGMTAGIDLALGH